MSFRPYKGSSKPISNYVDTTNYREVKCSLISLQWLGTNCTGSEKLSPGSKTYITCMPPTSTVETISQKFMPDIVRIPLVKHVLMTQVGLEIWLKKNNENKETKNQSLSHAPNKC